MSFIDCMISLQYFDRFCDFDGLLVLMVSKGSRGPCSFLTALLHCMLLMDDGSWMLLMLFCGRGVIDGFDSLHDFQMVIIAMLFMRSIHFHGIPGANGFQIHWRCLVLSGSVWFC